MRIGDWVRRTHLTTWHLVESVVADDGITKCGRRFDNERGYTLFVPNREEGLGPDDDDRCASCARDKPSAGQPGV